MKKRFFSKVLSAALCAVMVLSLAACGQSGQTGQTDQQGQAQQDGQPQASTDGKKVINLGVTYAPGNINPLSPVNEVASYATGLMFLPLMEVGSDMQYHPMLAESVTSSEDNKTFTIKLDERATWTDGEPVTADDLIFTIRCIANEKVGSIYAYMYAAFDGFDEYGYIPEEVEEVPGIVRVDDKTVQLIAKEPMNVNTFNNAVSRYLWVIPQHKLKDIPAEELIGSSFFQKPDVTNGPFKMIAYDRNHYIQLEANKDYFKGAPKIDQLNFNVMQGSQIYARLQSGEIDFNLPNLGVIPVEDFENVQALPGVTTFLEEPIANQYMYINEKAMPDVRVRQAMVYAINRQQIVDELLKGNGEVVDGYLTSYSPYFDESLGVTPYDPEKAKALLAEAGWDSNQELTMLIASGDDTMAQAANIIAANLGQVGIKVKIQVNDLNTLLDQLYAMEHDLAIVQYSFMPADPYPDFSYLMMTGNVNGYSNAEADAAFLEIKGTSDDARLKELYSQVNRIAKEEVPMFSVYATRGLAAMSDRVTGVELRQFGAFINVQDWDVVA